MLLYFCMLIYEEGPCHFSLVALFLFVFIRWLIQRASVFTGLRLLSQQVTFNPDILRGLFFTQL